jgi:hypothetical protein
MGRGAGVAVWSSPVASRAADIMCRIHVYRVAFPAAGLAKRGWSERRLTRAEQENSRYDNEINRSHDPFL